MGWAMMLVFAMAIAFGLWRFARLERGALELVAAALLLAIAGYALQGNPQMIGNPVDAAEAAPAPPAAEAALRRAMTGRFSSEGEVLSYADAFNAAGHSRSSVSILSATLKKEPSNPDLWVGLGNALVIHGGGMMNPAAQFAFERAAELAPTHPGPPFFFGLALAQSGKFDEAGDVWRGLLARAPDQAPWKADLEARLAQIGQSPRAAAGEKPQP